MSVGKAQLCHIIIDATELSSLDDHDFYRMVAIKIIRQLLKKDICDGLLNIPLPKSHHTFNLFLQAVQEELPSCCPILIVLNNPNVLNEKRRERFSSIFSQDQRIGLVLA